MTTHLLTMMAVLPFFLAVGMVVAIIPYWFIWKKAGFSPWLSLLVIVPLVNLVMLYVLAFSEWKVVPVGQPQYPQYPRI